MKILLNLLVVMLVFTSSLATAQEAFLTNPKALHTDPRWPGDRVFLVADLFDRMQKYDSVMVDEPVIFVASNSPYSGFKASDMAKVAQAIRAAFSSGVSSEPVSFGNYKVTDQPGASTLYVRIALRNVYVRKNKRGLLAYTPAGAVIKGATDLAKDTFDKSTLVEMAVEMEVQDSATGEVLAAMSMARGQQADKKAKIQEESAGWDATGQIAEIFGRRLACRLDNARLPEDARRDCIAAIPMHL